MTEVVKIVCSTIPGYESVALLECKEKLQVEAKTDVRGRISVDIEVDRVEELAELRSVNHYWVVVSDIECFFKVEQTKETVFEELSKLPATLDWSKAFKTWKRFRSFKLKHGGLDPMTKKRKKEEPDSDAEQVNYDTINPAEDGEKVRFRATASRTGSHQFNSMECACHFGGGVNDHFNWKVNLTNYDLEVVLYIVDTFISVGIQLTKESQSLRNITHFGPTTLRPNISYCLLKSTLAQPGINVILFCSTGCARKKYTSLTKYCEFLD